MRIRPSAVWLLNSALPSGAGVMALRRMDVLRRQLASTALALDRPGGGTAPAEFRAIRQARAASSVARLLRADLVVTTSERTLDFAAKNAPRRAVLVHLVHTTAAAALRNDRLMRTIERASWVVIPASFDAPVFARSIGLPPERVVNQDDFTLASEFLLATARSRVVVAAGRFVGDSGVLELVNGFGDALPELPGWQLRLYGWGRYRADLVELIDERGWHGRVMIMGPTHPLAAEYLDAGVVARLAADEASGLSVPEALTAGVPVLGAQSVPAVRRLVVDGRNGVVLARTDSASVAAALVELSDPGLRSRLADGARALPSGTLTEEGHEDVRSLFAGFLDSREAPMTKRRTTRVEKPAAKPTAEQTDVGSVHIGELTYLVADDLSPAAARARVLGETLDALEQAGVRGFVVKGASWPGPTVGVLEEHRATALGTIGSRFADPGAYFQEIYPNLGRQPVNPVTARRMAQVPNRCSAVRVARLWTSRSGSLRYGMDYGTRIEFWSAAPDDPDLVVAPQANAAAREVHRDFLKPASITVEGRQRASISLFDRTFLDEVDFPVDAVYTWVDGDEPQWLQRFQRARAEAEGVPHHPEAHAANRYENRDELRYSLRSLEMYAPWIRHIYLVTDRQTPSWLASGSDRVKVVDHRDIYADPRVLPVFNSSAIISQLHHIPGLSEHYLYLNDDMFFGTDVRPDDFWFASGIAKVFPSRLTRPFGAAHAGDNPHFNISKNIRAALEQTLGRSLSLAIRHTPYPQIRSVNAEIEERFGEILRNTAGQRFRHHTDVAQDQLFHYYAQATGRAVPSTISYDYVNVGAASDRFRLRRLLATRQRAVFCLNDAPEPGEEPIPRSEVIAFLEAYFPLKGSLER